MLDIKCNTCGGQLSGRGVLLIPQTDDELEGSEGFFLDLRCFDELIHEMMKQETTTMVTIAIGTIQDLYDSVEMRGDI